MKSKKIIIVIGLNLLFLNTFNLLANNIDTNNLEIGIVEHLNEFVPDNILLIDENGDTINLKKTINKPTVLCFVYFECPMLCTPLMNGLSDVIDKTDLTIGKDYQVLTIGFNTEEPLSMAIAKKKNYIGHMKNKQAVNGWKFFVSDSLNIAKATSSMGFRYKKAGNIFLHSATLIFISPEGKITRYLNGTYYLPFEFKMAITEASKGVTGPTINKLIQYCYGYDSQAQRYVMDVTKVGGILILLILVIIVSILLIKPILQKKHTHKT
jgi:protein SCO1